MANLKSAIHRIMTAKRNSIKNKKYNSITKTVIKKYQLSLSRYNQNLNDVYLKKSKNDLNFVYSKLGKSLKIQLFHTNSIARKKSALKKLYNLKKINLILRKNKLTEFEL